MKVLLYNERGIEVLKELKDITLDVLKKYECPLFPATNPVEIDNLFAIYTLAINNAAGLEFAVKGDQAPEFISKLEPYNNFNAEKIAKKLFQIIKIRSYYNEGNPNNGGCLIEKVWFNLDYSEIILDFGLVDNEDVDELTNVIKLFGLPGADEIELVVPYTSDRYTHIQIRNWWD